MTDPIHFPQRRYWQTGQGDTLSSLATRIYRNPAEWVRIYNANRSQLTSPEDVRPGMILEIP